MLRTANSLVLFALLILATFKVAGQSSRFKILGVNEGICHPFVYTINEDKNGFLWLGTGVGLCRYDGLNFTRISDIDTLVTDVATVSYTDSYGNLWFGFNDATLIRWNGETFERIVLAAESPGPIRSIVEMEDGGLLIATQKGGVFRYTEATRKVEDFDQRLSDYMISDLLYDNQRLLVATMDGLVSVQLNRSLTPVDYKVLPQLNYINVQTLSKTPWPDVYLAGTEDSGVFLLRYLNDSAVVAPVGTEYDLSNENVQDIHFDNTSNLWICTYYSGLLKISGIDSLGKFKQIERYTSGHGMATNYIRSAYSDTEGNLWIGTYGAGLALLSGGAFSFETFDELENNSVTAIAKSNHYLWFGAQGNIVEQSVLTGVKTIINKKQGLPNDIITSLVFDKNTLYIGTQSNGIYIYEPGSGKVTPYFIDRNTLASSINYMLIKDEMLYVASKDGIYLFSLNSTERYHFNTRDGLVHNDIEQIFIDAEGRLLYATRSNGISEIDVLGKVNDYFTVGKYQLEFNSICEDYNGNVWTSTNGMGVFNLLADTALNITERDGLKSEYCYGIVCSDSQYVWVGHRLGLSRVNVKDYSIKVFDNNVGIQGDCNPNAMLVDTGNKMYIGTTNGVVIYDIKLGMKSIPAPRTNISSVLISDIPYDYSSLIHLPYGVYKLKIGFIGINFNDPEGVRYQYKLEGYDLEWSDLTNVREITYTRVEDGDYKFLLRSYSVDGLTNEVPVSFTLRVKPPFWKRWWFILLVFIIIFGGVYVIIKYRERKQKQIQEYLEKRLDERTREVVEQKEEIETKNRDITDSINYAQRIQSSILPPLKKLQQNFSGSFIYYQPRDIVSGDFYWFDKINESKFIIVCADSTGHGVPGAFMSMIGTTLIKDICFKEGIESPSKILRELDFELRNTLNQNSESEDQSNDGMDIIVCEIDVSTNYMRYASAMRPLIVYRNGNQMYLKGSRNSVGGHYESDKEFKDEGLQLSKGDIIYMFSDGYPDQFGGPMRKKFKMVRLKNLLKDIYQKPMEEQYEYVKSTFELWKEEVEQVDDVLFMGVKI